MKKLEIVNSLSRGLHRAGLQFKKHSPEVLVTAGVVGGVAAAVMACKATTKASSVLEEMHDDLEKIHKVSEMEEVEYTEEDLKKDTAIVYVQTGVKFAKLYGPSIALGALSITSILVGHNILRKRNLAISAAYATVSNGFKEYRERVVDRFGKELDNELRYNIKAKEVETEEVDPETGEVRTGKKTVNVAEIRYDNDYTRIFDDGCIGWTKDPEYNKLFLRRQQDNLNELLQRKGYLFLNEAYKAFGFAATKAGQVVGWVYDKNHPTYVDLGIFDPNDEAKRNFINGRERTIILDFNVQGNILDLI